MKNLKLLTIAKVAEELGVSRTIVYWWISDCGLPVVELPGFGRKHFKRINMGKLEKFLESHETVKGKPKVSKKELIFLERKC